MSKPFRFAVQSFSADSGKEWSERAKQVESLGYSALHLADHIIGPGPALTRSNHPIQSLAAVPAMCFAAAATDTLKIGCRVFCVDYHHPVVLAKQAMTIDLLSGGRLELGLGAGWLKDEYEAIGIPMDSPGVRIDRLADVIEGIKSWCQDQELSVDNTSLHWKEFEGLPKPASSPHPPIMIGGGGKKVLQLGGREADIVSLNFNNRSGVIGPDGVQSSSESETIKKIDWIRESAGPRFDDIEIEIGAYFTFVMDDPTPVIANFSEMFGYSASDMRKHPHALFGSVDTICEELQRRRELFGISYITVGDTAMEPFSEVVARLAGT